MKKFAYALPLLAVFAAPTVLAASQQEASEAILHAVKLNNQAHAAGFEWRDTYKKLLGPAKKAYHKGDYDKAEELASKAASHAQLGIQQAAVADQAKPRF